MQIGDRVFYGIDPRKMGFPLKPDEIGTVSKIHVNCGLRYLTVIYPGINRKPLCYPEHDFTLYKEQGPCLYQNR